MRKLFLTSFYSMGLIQISMSCALNRILHVLTFLYVVFGLFNLQIEEVNYLDSLIHSSLITTTEMIKQQK